MLKHLLVISIMTFGCVGLSAQAPRDSEVRALVEAAMSIRQDLDHRRAAREAGIEVEPVESHEEQFEHLVQVLEALAKHQTPEVIPALVAFIETGGPVPNALADFGEQAVPALLVIEAGNDGLAAWSALSIFAKMFARPSVRHPLSSDSRQKIIGIARARLRDQPRFAVGLSELRLAVATREPDLIERVKLIATDERLATELAGGEPRRANVLRRFAVQSLKEAGFSTQ